MTEPPGSCDRRTVVVLDEDDRRRFALVLAEGWHVHDAPGTLAVLRPARDHGGFRTNVVIRRERVHRRFDLAAVMGASERHVNAGYDAVEVRGEHSGRCGDAPALVRLRAFEVRGDARRLSQLHALIDAGLASGDEPDEGARADPAEARVVYQVVATCLADDAAAFRDAFAMMIGSCCITQSPAGERREELE